MNDRSLRHRKTKTAPTQSAVVEVISDESDEFEYPSQLPGECWANIARYLDTQELGRLARVCRAFA
jgi:hypothetical protein